MKADECPICEQKMTLVNGKWYCDNTPECIEQQMKDVLFAYEIAAYLKQSKRFVERRRAEAEEWLQERQEGGEA